MTSCASYVADPSFQLASTAGSTGGVDCTAHATSTFIDSVTCGAKDPGGRAIRLLSNEPIPDPKSPGLNLVQVAKVALEHYGVYMDVRIGSRSVPWPEYERRRKAGQPTIIQVRYRPIAVTNYDAGRGFEDNHALAETTHATYDSLADGRPGCFEFNGKLYIRSVIQVAGSQLDIGGGARPRPGTVWAAFGHDVVPDFRVTIPAGYAFWAYQLDAKGDIKPGSKGRKARRSDAGIDQPCSTPAYHHWPESSVPYKRLVRIAAGAHAGMYVEARYSKEA